MTGNPPAPGTSYTSATPTLKDKKGLIKELGQRKAVDLLSEGMSADEKELMNVAFRGMYGKIEQKKADKKAQSAAVRSTVTTAVTTAITMGAAGALGPGFQGVMSTIGAGSAKLGEAVVRTVLQIADGSRNGFKGVLAAAANGALSMITQGASPNSSVAVLLRQATKSFGLGIGISYDNKNGWGGMLGIGNSINNISVSASEFGVTNVSGSINGPGMGSQLTLNHTLTGDTTMGINFNNDQGPRNGLNLGLNYSLDSGRTSGNVSYTMPNNLLAISSNIDQKGFSTSTSYNGVSMGTNTANGYQANEFNWAQENINAAQNIALASERLRKLSEQESSKQISADIEAKHKKLKNGKIKTDLLRVSGQPGLTETLPDGTVVERPRKGKEQIYRYTRKDNGILGFGATETVVEIGPNGKQINRIVQSGTGFLSKLMMSGNTHINGSTLQDGNGIYRDTKGRLAVMEPGQLVTMLNGSGSNKRFIITQNGMDNLGLDGIRMNTAARETTIGQINESSFGGSLHVFNGTRTVFGDLINHKVSDLLSTFGKKGVEKADKTWDLILNTKAMGNANVLIAHSQGAQILTNALVRNNQNGLDNKSTVFLVGGAHGQIAKDGVDKPSIVDIRNASDPIPFASRLTGSIFNFNEEKALQANNYRMLEQNERPTKMTNDGYVLWQSETSVRDSLRWSNQNAGQAPGTGHSFDQYVPGIKYYYQNQENIWGK